MMLGTTNIKSICQFPIPYPSRATARPITFQLDATPLVLLNDNVVGRTEHGKIQKTIVLLCAVLEVMSCNL